MGHTRKRKGSSTTKGALKQQLSTSLSSFVKEGTLDILTPIVNPGDGLQIIATGGSGDGIVMAELASKSTIEAAEDLTLAECCHHTHPWKTFDFEQVRNSARFAYLADPLMKTGYSIQKRRRDVVLSLFAFHNETINVWSHLLGGILFIVLFYSWYIEAEPTVRLGQFAHDSFDNLALRMTEISSEAKKYSNALTKEAEAFRLQSQTLAETLAIRIASVPTEFRAEMSHQKDVFSTWLREERVAVESAIHTLERKGGEWLRRVAILEWIAVHTVSSENADMEQLTRVLKEKLSAFIPKDFEARRAAAALRGWLEDERRTIENLLFRFDPQSTSTPVWPVLIFCFGGVMCLGCSAVYHWWVGYCRHYHDALCRVDLAGISFMIWGSSVPLIYYVFIDDEFWRNAYLGGATVLCGATLAFTALPADVLHRVKVYRVLAYLAAGAFVVAPLIHSICRWGLYSEEVRRYVNDGYLALVGFFYVFGAFIYVSRIPEKYYPGKFDLVFASHQIWHALVFAAAYVHYFGAVELYLWRVEKELTGNVVGANVSSSV
jgi:channel protein (hemolysin III family)